MIFFALSHFLISVLEMIPVRLDTVRGVRTDCRPTVR